MAIQKINLGTEPLGEGGDTYRSANTKINENFSNTEHAASKLVGATTGQVPLAEHSPQASFNFYTSGIVESTDPNAFKSLPSGTHYFGANSDVSKMPYAFNNVLSFKGYNGTGLQIYYGYTASQQNLYYRTKPFGNGSFPDTVFKIYTDTNTKKDSRSNLLIESGDSIPTTSAASRVVGVGPTNIPDVSNLNRAILVAPREGNMVSPTEFDAHTGGEYRYTNTISYEGVSKIPDYLPTTWHQYCLVTSKNMTSGRMYQEAIRTTGQQAGVIKMYRSMNVREEWSDWHHEWNTQNTTVDSSGFIKKASPVLRVFSDRIEGNEDGKKMEAKFVKNGVGDYLIKGATGLAEEGWYIEIPRDANGNNLVAVEYNSLENGDVSLKTYKRMFDFETVRIVADHDNPLDIPDTRWIDLRFNDLPMEDTAESEPVDEPIVDGKAEPEVVEESSEESK